MRNLIYNAIRTPDGTVLESTYRHDYRTHIDVINRKEYMIDGGLDYSRRSAHGDEKDLCLYDDEPHTIQRKLLTWGTRGKAGDEPLKYIPISGMELDHLEKVLETQPVAATHRSCMETELKLRKDLTY